MRVGFQNWIEVYWCEAQAWWEQAEYATMLYATELAEYKETNPQPNLKNYMIQTKGQPR